MKADGFAIQTTLGDTSPIEIDDLMERDTQLISVLSYVKKARKIVYIYVNQSDNNLDDIKKLNLITEQTE